MSCKPRSNDPQAAMIAADLNAIGNCANRFPSRSPWAIPHFAKVRYGMLSHARKEDGDSFDGPAGRTQSDIGINENVMSDRSLPLRFARHRYFYFCILRDRRISRESIMAPTLAKGLRVEGHLPAGG